MKKLTTVLFILIALVVLFLMIRQNIRFPNAQANIQTQQFSSSSQGDQNTSSTSDLFSGGEDISVLIPLLPDENVVTVLSVEFNQDNYVDQIVALKNSESPYIKIIIGIYNPLFGTFERAYEIQTEIQQTRTFSVDVLDITGTHENSLIIYGYSQANESILQVWLSRNNDSGLNLRLIADLSADGTIFVNQEVRSNSYAFSSENSNSFPIWVYTSDTSVSQGVLDQLQIMYDWDEVTSKYVQKSQTRISGRNINAQELAKIQDGTEKTFGTFLTETWLKTTSDTNNSSYLFFNYPEKTITFLNQDTAEIYVWENSILRTNGILIYATNQNIPNLLRRVDLTLISVDEIRVKSTDTLTMIASPSTMWDGNYKKQQIDSVNVQTNLQAELESEKRMTDTLKTTSGKIWEADNGYLLTFSESEFTAKNGNTLETGSYTVSTVYNEEFLQFKSFSDSNVFNGFYKIQIIEAQENSGMQIILLPTSIGLTHIAPSVNQKITLQQVNR